MKARASIGALVATAAIAFAACSSAASPAAPTSAASESAGASAAPSATPKTIGVVLISANDPANHIMVTAAEAEAKTRGWTLNVIDANGSADAANTAIENLVQSKVDGILVAVFPSTALGAGLAKANEAHIPVVSWGGGLDNGVLAATDQGAPLAKPVAEQLVKDLQGKGEVLELTYHVGLICRNRELALDEVLAGYPDIKVTKNEVVLPGYVESGASSTTAWLAGHPAGSANLAVWGCWDGPATGALSALEQAGRTDVKVYGQNGEAAAIKAIKDGKYTATMWEDSATEGRQLIIALDDIFKAGSSWVPKTINVPGVLVTKDNVDQFIAEHPEVVQ